MKAARGICVAKAGRAARVRKQRTNPIRIMANMQRLDTAPLTNLIVVALLYCAKDGGQVVGHFLTSTKNIFRIVVFDYCK